MELLLLSLMSQNQDSIIVLALEKWKLKLVSKECSDQHEWGHLPDRPLPSLRKVTLQ